MTHVSMLLGLRWSRLSTFLVLAIALRADTFTEARDRQDRPALEKAAAELAAAANGNDAAAYYRAALVNSYLAEVATEMRDKGAAKNAAEAGIKAAERAVALNPKSAEHHRLLGTLCGQVIPANLFAGIKYGRCALDEINKAIEIDGRFALAYVSRGVGNYYLPPSFGGGVDKAIQDFQKAIELNPKLAEAHLWMGVALRKANRNAEARQAFTKSLQLNPNRVWTKQQLEKTPAQ